MNNAHPKSRLKKVVCGGLALCAVALFAGNPTAFAYQNQWGGTTVIQDNHDGTYSWQNQGSDSQGATPAVHNDGNPADLQQLKDNADINGQRGRPVPAPWPNDPNQKPANPQTIA